ncbi:MAG TPA: acyloxyacyl hydrolase [Salinimicrobium sp.]|nr:acyloxyacyl hydrolase [Salinimicrobium sp.]
MKKILIFLLFFGNFLMAQEKLHTTNSFDTNFFYGYILEHSPEISHLITGHPEGIILSWNRETYGFNEWESRFNYPDFGVSFAYQDMKNRYLGEHYGIYAHMNFYFLKRHLMFRMGTGISYNTNPYDPNENYFNNAYGSHLLNSTYFMLNFKKEKIIGPLGIQFGIDFIHYSNADLKVPNTSTNTISANFGLNYQMDSENEPEYHPIAERTKYSEPLHVNFVLRSGVNNMDVIGTPAYPFFTASIYADKRISHISTFQLGTEIFLSKALEEFIHYDAVAFPQAGTKGDEDAKRVGGFLGHQLTFNQFSVITHLGYYLYYPFERYVERVYNRVGLQYDFYNRFFASVSLRSHAANAEALEFSIGFRL